MDNFYLTCTAGLLWVFLMSMSFQLLIAEEKPNRIQQYEMCRCKFFTTYPEEINQKAWRNCINGKD